MSINKGKGVWSGEERGDMEHDGAEQTPWASVLPSLPSPTAFCLPLLPSKLTTTDNCSNVPEMVAPAFEQTVPDGLHTKSVIFLIVFFFLFNERHAETCRDTGRGRSRLPVQSLMGGLNPRTPGSQPDPKADAQPLSHPGAPKTSL